MFFIFVGYQFCWNLGLNQSTKIKQLTKDKLLIHRDLFRKTMNSTNSWIHHQQKTAIISVKPWKLVFINYKTLPQYQFEPIFYVIFIPQLSELNG